MSLFTRVRRAISASQVGVEPHSWALPSPSSYSTSKPGGKLQTVIPDPKIFANAHIPGHIEYNTEKNPLVYPDVSHGAVHLALLECFYNLRLSATDVDLDCPPAYEERPTDDGADATSHDAHRWHTLIRLAVTRFEGWWASIDSVLNHAAIYAYRPSERIGVQLTKDYLPPLDVLFVWYTFMLDTDSYRLECCDPRHTDHLRQLCFPWSAVREALDVDTMQYTLPRAAQVLFDTMSGQSAEIPSYLRDPPAYTEQDMVPLHVDLFEIAKRHDDFIDEAHRLLWIRSPALYGSLERASVAYFASQLLRGGEAMEGDRILSFGVELIWRTHRLYSEQYECFQRVMREYPKHHDGEEGDADFPANPRTAAALSPDTPDALNALDSTSTSSSSSSAEICICWTCERIRDDVPEFVHPTSATSSSDDTPTTPTTPTVQSQLVVLSSAQIRQILDDLGFFTAVEKARSDGRALPVRSSSASEQDADRVAGSMAGLFEYFEKMPDGSYKVRKQTQAVAWSGLQV